MVGHVTGYVKPCYKNNFHAFRLRLNLQSVISVFAAMQGPNPEKKAIMCAYKLCKVEFRYWGMQSKIERFIHDIGEFTGGIFLNSVYPRHVALN